MKISQIRKNLLTNIFALLANILVGLLYTPFLVRNIGLVAYGVIPLSLLLNQYINILANSLTRAVTRFYSVEYKKGNFEQASVFFVSSILFSLLLAIICIPICLIPIYYIDVIFDIPVELVTPARCLFLLSVISFFVSVICNCINITIFSENRLDLINYVKITRQLTKLLFNVFLFAIFGPSLIWIGVAYLFSEALSLLLSIIAYKRTKPRNIVFRISYYSSKVIRPIFSMISWIALISFADIFIYKIDSVLITNYFGLENTGVLGSISEFGSYCISLTAVIGSLFAPLILIAYSETRHNDVCKLAIDGGYIVCLVSCLVCGLVIGASKAILQIWLNPEIAQYHVWMIIKTIVIPFTAVGGVYATVYNYWNRVKQPAILSLIISIVYVGISIVLLNRGIGIITFLCINVVAVFLQGFIMNAYMLNKIYVYQKKGVKKNFIRSLVYLVMVSAITGFFCHLFTPSSIVGLVGIISLSGIVGVLLLFVFINQKELEMLDLVVPVGALKNS